jgi:hypothetical protein
MECNYIRDGLLTIKDIKR